MKMRRAEGSPKERGAVLLVALIILVVMTILGITATQTTIVEEKMAGNLRDKDVAFRAAEAGLQEGLTYLDRLAGPPEVNGAGTQNVWPGCTIEDGDSCGCTIDDGESCVGKGSVAVLETADQAIDYDDASAWGADLASAPLPGVSAQPRIAIEHRYVPPLDVEAAARGRGVHFYTVSALGYGASPTAKVLLQATVAKVYGY
ncbi:MAG: PilX N-terminal domain-containing pilus assembly protein [Chromatiaceae bacterium]|jgi:type IV pilus assembly protein PilX